MLDTARECFMIFGMAAETVTSWTEIYKVTSFLVNLRGQAGLSTILSFIQDVGWQHAIHMQIKLPKDQGWVFTRQKLQMTKWPAWNQSVKITTWLRPPSRGPFLFRDYEIFLTDPSGDPKNDERIGVCTSSFTVMDMKLRKLASVDWTSFPKAWKDEDLFETVPDKIAPLPEGQDLAQFEVRNSDIDLNRHVNNVKYSQWILDSIPIEILRGETRLTGFEVNFLAEAKTGDVIKIQQGNAAAESAPPAATSVIQFQGLRVGDGKAVFTARLETGGSDHA